jgi:uncharacterized membrane protein YgaE (UPF0421/DUF939 family)
MNQYVKLALKVVGGIVGLYALFIIGCGAAGLINYYFISGNYQAVQKYVKSHEVYAKK